MSESYKTHSDGLYFVSFSVVGWLDLPDGRQVYLQEENTRIY
jgi:hypothetical protein